MAYFFQRMFQGVEGHRTVEEEGPEALKRDIDELAKYFDPNSVHDDGSPGGIGYENLGGLIWQGREDPDTGELVYPSEGIGSKPIPGLPDPNNPDVDADKIYTQIKSLFDLLGNHVDDYISSEAHGLAVDEVTSILRYIGSDGNWHNAMATANPESLSPLINNLYQILPGIGGLDAAQGRILGNLESGYFKGRFNTAIAVWSDGKTAISNSIINQFDCMRIELNNPNNAQAKAWADAFPAGESVSDGLAIVRAMGTVPQISIPIICYVEHRR